MYKINNIYVAVDGIRTIHYEVDDSGRYMVITYAYDKENPTKIQVIDFGEYENLSSILALAVNNNKLCGRG